MAHVLLKIYAGLHPVDASLLPHVQAAGKDAMGNDEPWLFLQGDILQISFEGIYFPSDAVLQVLAQHLPENAQGKLDIIDLDAWTLQRNIWTNGMWQAAPPRDLNQIMDYSGH